MDAGHACSLLSGFDITIAGFMNTNGSDASAAIARISCDDVVHLLSLHVCLHLSSDADIEMEPRAGSPPLVILTTPSRAIPAPLVGLRSSVNFFLAGQLGFEFFHYPTLYYLTTRPLSSYPTR